MLSVQDAVQHMLQAITPIQETETVPLAQAVNLVLARAILSPINSPNYTNSAMDGYAFNAAELASLTPPFNLKCVGESLAGHPYKGTLAAGACIRIMTGAVVPDSVDTVVPVENTAADADSMITFLEPVRAGSNIRYQGEELQVGQEIYPAGHAISPVDIGMLASLGFNQLQVYKRLKVAVFSTGDELVLPGQTCQPHQLYDSNRYVLHAMLEQLGFEVINLGLIPDDPAHIAATFEQAATQAHAIICSGGVSVGDADYTKQVIDELGQVGFWKVAMKPGKPFAFGTLKDRYFFGLPGNPVSATVTFMQLAQPALEHLSGQLVTQYQPTLFHAIAAEPLKKRPGRADFQRGIVRYEQGENRVYSTGQQGSGMLSSLVEANCLIHLTAEQGSVQTGDSVLIEYLTAPLKRSL